MPDGALFEELTLSDTRVSDLRPINRVSIAPGHGNNTLRLGHTPAVAMDPQLAQIDGMQDHKARVETLLAYLKDWEPPLPQDAESGRTYRYTGDGPIRSLSTTPNDDDADQEDLRQDLCKKIQRLSEILGGSNELGYLSETAANYADHIKRPYAQIRLKLLYASANSLRVAYEAHESAKAQARDMECLPPLVAAALKDVVETHSLFFMGIPEGRDIHSLAMSGLTGERRPDIAALAADVVDALLGEDDVLAPDDQTALADDLVAAKGEGPSAEIGERKGFGSLTNAILSAVRFIWRHKKSIVGGVGGAYTALKWMVNKQDMIIAFLASYQGPMAAWFKAMIDTIRPWV